METHDVIKAYECHLCDYSANTLGYIKLHYTRFHKGHFYDPLQSIQKRQADSNTRVRMFFYFLFFFIFISQAAYHYFWYFCVCNTAISSNSTGWLRVGCRADVFLPLKVIFFCSVRRTSARFVSTYLAICLKWNAIYGCAITCTSQRYKIPTNSRSMSSQRHQQTPTSLLWLKTRTWKQLRYRILCVRRYLSSAKREVTRAFSAVAEVVKLVLVNMCVYVPVCFPQ